ncbi:tRNA sulfurtransferase [Salinirubrum litoreum]|uniref:Probable tRNA sulfurtransferase n=1 Tax=Salinirubrum litoreum TaxID=1126234 RepID=A0ABD5R9X4_9EURY
MNTVRSADWVVLVAYGEIGVKSSGVRREMVETLADNLRALLADRDLAAEVEARWSRLFVHPADSSTAPADRERVTRLAEAVADCVGVVSARPSLACSAELDAVLDALRDFARDAPAGDSFAVRARRVGPDEAHDFSAREIEREGGSLIESVTGASVDLDDPDRTYRVEVREDTAFVSAREFSGPGGLPLGTQGKSVLLLSGGIDSPVAGYELLRRGCEIVPLYLDLGDYGGPDHRARAVETARVLRRYAPDRLDRLWVAPAGDLVADLTDSVGDTRMLSLRRAMLVVAESVAQRLEAHSVTTGESLGQKSSQTGPNLAVTDAAVSLPVHRPLLTRDKNDVTEQARRIGTFDDSTLPVGCERVAPPHPETNATLAAVVAAEPEDLLERARSLAESVEPVDL